MYQNLERTIDSNTSLTDMVISFISNIWTIKIITDIKYYFNKIRDNILDNSNQNYSLNKKIAKSVVKTGFVATITAACPAGRYFSPQIKNVE